MIKYRLEICPFLRKRSSLLKCLHHVLATTPQRLSAATPVESCLLTSACFRTTLSHFIQFPHLQRMSVLGQVLQLCSTLQTYMWTHLTVINPRNLINKQYLHSKVKGSQFHVENTSLILKHFCSCCGSAEVHSQLVGSDLTPSHSLVMHWTGSALDLLHRVFHSHRFMFTNIAHTVWNLLMLKLLFCCSSLSFVFINHWSCYK